MSGPHTPEFPGYDNLNNDTDTTKTSLNSVEIKGVNFNTDNPDFGETNGTVSDLLDMITEVTESGLSDIGLQVEDIKTNVEGVFGLGYSLDENGNVYYEFNPEYHSPTKIVVENADKDTFKVLGGGYAVDKNYVFHKGSLLKGVSSEGFEYLSTDEYSLYNGFGAFGDFVNSKVIVNGEILEGVDLGNFGYSQKLMCWTDGNTALRRNYVVNKLSDREKGYLGDTELSFPKPSLKSVEAKIRYESEKNHIKFPELPKGDEWIKLNNPYGL